MPRNKQTKDKKQVVQVARLADLPRREDVVIHIELEQFGDRPTLGFDLRSLPYSEWLQCARDIPIPQAPMDQKNPFSKSGEKVEINYDTEDPAYKRAVDERGLKINYNRLIHSLIMDIGGATLDEQIAELESYLGWGLIDRLVSVMYGIALEGERSVSERADTFHERRTPRTQSNGTSGLDASAVELAVSE